MSEIPRRPTGLRGLAGLPGTPSPGRTPGRAPGRAPVGVPGQVPGRALGRALDRVPGKVGQVPGKVPGRRVPGRVPGRVFGRGRPGALSRQQRHAARSRRLEVAAAAAAAALGLLAGVYAPGRGDIVREARASSSIAAGVSRPHAVDAPGDAPDSGSTAGLMAIPGERVETVTALPMERSAPTRVRIPQIGTDVSVFGADLAPDGGPPTPSEANAMRAAWYAGGVSPGERGAAILVGHLDTFVGPAAFAGLGSLQAGEIIEIERQDGSTAVFTVDSVELYPKEDFPDERVYGAVDTPQLRLITCGGRWSASGGYDANIVAYARLTGTTSHTAAP